MENDNPTRVVRVYAIDLAMGDVVVTIGGEYVGTVENHPTWTAGVVDVPLYDGEHSIIKPMATNKLVRIEIPRRTR